MEDAQTTELSRRQSDSKIQADLKAIAAAKDSCAVQLLLFQSVPSTDREALVKAYAWLVTYPLRKELCVDAYVVGNRDSEVLAAAESLGELIDRTHIAATHFVMSAVEALEIDSAAVWSSSQYCRELLGRPGGEYYPRDRKSDMWPDCLGKKLLELPQDIRVAITAGAAILQRLNVKVSAEQMANELQAANLPATEAPYLGLTLNGRVLSRAGFGEIELSKGREEDAVRAMLSARGDEITKDNMKRLLGSDANRIDNLRNDLNEKLPLLGVHIPARLWKIVVRDVPVNVPKEVRSRQNTKKPSGKHVPKKGQKTR